jgi:hypothetical protein
MTTKTAPQPETKRSPDLKDRLLSFTSEMLTQLEAEGLTRSDAQGAVDVEILEGWRPTDFQPWMLLPEIEK